MVVYGKSDCGPCPFEFVDKDFMIDCVKEEVQGKSRMKQNLARQKISWKRAKELAHDRVWWRFFKWRITIQRCNPGVEAER